MNGLLNFLDGGLLNLSIPALALVTFAMIPSCEWPF